MWAVAFSMFIITKTRKKCKYLRLSVRTDSFFVAKRGVKKPLERIVMKKDWKKKLKRMGAVFLLAALLVQMVDSHIYMADAGDAFKEKPG